MVIGIGLSYCLHVKIQVSSGQTGIGKRWQMEQDEQVDDTIKHSRKSLRQPIRDQHSVYPEILTVIKFVNLPEIWQKCIIGGI